MRKAVGQKVSPIGFRIGITEEWRSRWYAPKAAFGEFLVEDQKVRRFIDERLNRQPPYAAVARMDIERTRNEVKVVLFVQSYPSIKIASYYHPLPVVI